VAVGWLVGLAALGWWPPDHRVSKRWRAPAARRFALLGLPPK